MAVEIKRDVELPGELHTYFIQNKLGSGGFGSVHHAVYKEKDGTSVEVAIKELKDRSGKYFEQEARNLQQLDHEYLPEIIESFVIGDQRFIVMEYIKGERLQKYIDKPVRRNQEKRPPLRKIVVPLLRVLYYMHKRTPPYIHQDIKPKNIVVSDRNGALEVVLVDLGLAKPYIGADQSDTKPSTSTGYSPPEQYEGRSEPRSDFYALGATIYFILTGEMPPHALKRTSGDIEKVLQRSGVSREMQAVTARLMAVEIEQRYSDIQSIYDDLEKTPEFERSVPIWQDPTVVSDPQPVRAPLPAPLPRRDSQETTTPPPRAPLRTSGWAWRGLGFLALGILLVIALPRLTAWLPRSSPGAPQPSPAAVSSAAPAPSQAASPAASPAPAGLASSAASSTPTIPPVAGRIAFVTEQGISLLSAGRAGPIQGTLPGDTSPRWSPNGQQIAFVSRRSGNSDIFVIGADRGPPRQLTVDLTDELYPTWSPDSKQIAFISQRQGISNVYRIDVSSQAVEPVTTNNSADVRYEDLSWAADGSLGAVVVRNGLWNIGIIYPSARQRDVTTNTSSLTLEMRGSTWAPDSGRIAYSRKETKDGPWNIYVTDLEGTDRRITNNTSSEIFLTQPTWSPDGTQIAFVSRSIAQEGAQQTNRYEIKIVQSTAETAESLPIFTDTGRIDELDWTR